jgi:hypothetical protein
LELEITQIENGFLVTVKQWSFSQTSKNYFKTIDEAINFSKEALDKELEEWHRDD